MYIKLYISRFSRTQTIKNKKKLIIFEKIKLFLKINFINIKFDNTSKPLLLIIKFKTL